jgi:glycosyltransferase involved in cell wall biosynthesis
MGGSVQSMALIARALCDRNEVTIFTTDHDSGFHLQFDHPRITCQVFPRTAGARYVSLPLLRELAGRGRDYDFIQVFSYWTFVAATGFGVNRLWDAPTFIHTQGIFLPVALRHHAWRKRFAKSLGAKSLLNRFCGAFLCTDAEVEPTRAWGAQIPLHVISNPVVPHHPLRPFDRERYGIPATAPVVLYLNRFDPVKRTLEMCLGLRQIQSQHETVHFVLAGDCDNPYGSVVRKYASDVGLRAHFPGHLSIEEKWKLLHDATLMCQFSAQEGNSNALLEGIAAGLPLVISRGCNFDAVEQQKAGIVIDSVDGLAEAALKILRNPSMASMMGQSGREFANKEFSIRVIGERYESVFFREGSRT